MATIPSIPEFYSGRKIFITGGSGFMGKVLIEKLLRSCPDVHTIYLLIRTKKGKRPEDRILDITKQALFDTIRQDDPGAFKKLHAISGDVKELGLGLSAEDKELLQREVSVVFHSAASVRFDESIKDAVLMNVRGTREVVNLALGMEKLQVFQHLSTAFSNVCEHGHAVEKIYPPPRGWDWKTAIKLAEMEGSEGYVNCLTPKILGPFIPNSYVFAKALGEQLINDYRDKLPLVIVRPSIVICAFDAPIAGWADNLNGPYAIWGGVYTGIVRSTYGKLLIYLDFVPVDVAVKSMIVIAWNRALSETSVDSQVPVYNCTSMLEPMSLQGFREIMGQVARDHPTTNMVWHPNCKHSSSWTYFYVNLMLFHVTYGFLLDAVMKYKGLKPIFGKIYRSLYTGTLRLTSFININYTFDNSEFLRQADSMLPSDRKEFGYAHVRKTDVDALRTIILGGRVNILKDPLETLSEARRKIVMLYWLDRVVKGASCLALLWALTTTSYFHSLAALFARWYREESLA